QIELALEVVENDLNVRDTEIICKKMKKPLSVPKIQPMKPALPREVELSLKDALGTGVAVQYKDGKGSLNVKFNSDEQLRAFANLLGNYNKEINK
ncbi:MAG: stage 0 sporulation protein J, partial [Oscillospiraceae bacterium]